MKTSGRRSRQGLTLIEVILAVALLSLGVVAILTAASRCLAVMKQARNYQTAQWVLAMGELEHPLRYDDDIMDLEVDPEIYEDNFVFSRTVEEDEDEDGLFAVRTRVSWAAQETEAYEEVWRYVLGPEED